MKAGPNDVPDIVWAQVSFLFSSFVLLETNEFFIVNIGCICNIGERERVGTTKMGPTMWDASFGPLVSLFLLFPSYYLILINILLHIQVVIYKIHETKRDRKLETCHVLSFRSTATASHQNHPQEKLGLEMWFVSSVGKSFCFLLYYFTNKF